MKSFLAICLFVIVIIVKGCDAPNDYVEFSKLPKDEKARRFKTLPLDTQIDYHLYSMSNEPPDPELASWIAQGGNEIIPAVLKRIKNEKQEFRKVDILIILEHLCHRGNCEETNPDLLQSIEIEVKQVKDPFWKERAESSLEYIKGKPVPLPTFPH